MKMVYIPIQKDYLNKSYCLAKAANLIDVEKDGLIMDIKDCAKEIYAYTVAKYYPELIRQLNSKCEWLFTNQDTIYLTDSGDKSWRKSAYNVIWTLPMDNK